MIGRFVCRPTLRLTPRPHRPLLGVMQIFIDSADIEEIRDAAAMGVVDGVTTNPSLVAKTGRAFRDVLVDICEVVDGPISAEVVMGSAGSTLSRAASSA